MPFSDLCLLLLRVALVLGVLGCLWLGGTGLVMVVDDSLHQTKEDGLGFAIGAFFTALAVGLLLLAGLALALLRGRHRRAGLVLLGLSAPVVGWAIAAMFGQGDEEPYVVLAVAIVLVLVVGARNAEYVVPASRP